MSYAPVRPSILARARASPAENASSANASISRLNAAIHSPCWLSRKFSSTRTLRCASRTFCFAAVTSPRAFRNSPSRNAIRRRARFTYASHVWNAALPEGASSRPPRRSAAYSAPISRSIAVTRRSAAAADSCATRACAPRHRNAASSRNRHAFTPSPPVPPAAAPSPRRSTGPPASAAETSESPHATGLPNPAAYSTPTHTPPD